MPMNSRSACAGLVFSSATGARAADKIHSMVRGVEKQIYLPAKLAEQLGYFKDEGLDVELLTKPSGVAAKGELLAGQLGDAPGNVWLVGKASFATIKSPADWRG